MKFKRTKFLKKKSWRIVMMFAAAAAFLLWVGQAPPPQTVSNTNISDTAQLLHPPLSLHQMNSAVQPITAYGTIDILFGDVEGMSNGTTQTYFREDDGTLYQIQPDQPLEFLPYNGDHVRISYNQIKDVVFDEFLVRPRAIVVESLDVLQDDNQNGVTGNTRWVNIACRFADMKDTTPKPMDYFQAMMVNVAPGMDHYWRTTSANLVNIEGSGAFGWYNLPDDKGTYTRLASVNTGNALQKLMNDCVKQAIDNDNVDFSQYGGINMMLNDTFGCCAWGGRMGVNVNGKTIQFRTTWLPPWAYDSLHVIAHEMGHGWGLPHSSGPYGKVYDSAWDIMSGGNTNHTDAICRVGDEKLGCYQVGTIGFHLAMLGWIPDNQMLTVKKGESATVKIDALTTIASSKNLLTVFVPTGSGNSFYTVDVRTFVDYDRNLPGEAVVLHQVVPNRSSPAHVVDGDNNGNPNDKGAMWLPGETFTDAQNKIKVEVLSREGNTFTVRITNG